MNQKLLTVLGCSSSVALTLLSPTSARANTTTEYVFTAPDINNNEIIDIPRRETDYPFFDCGCNEYDAAAIKQSDFEADKAIERYGCDCAGCRRLVRNVAKPDKFIPQILEN
ncbi:MAG: hypothetical protein QNJ32_18050 [Xenococcaceae cyanobacterium MO_167.B27]|nr:hypothetical protein [Xenococcaceae cyanobacterium MO_167.B27]